MSEIYSDKTIESDQYSFSREDQVSVKTLDEKTKKNIENPEQFKPSEITKDLVDKFDKFRTQKVELANIDEVDDEIGNDDIRFIMACRQAKKLFNELESTRIKPGYESYSFLLKILEWSKFLILVSVISILLFSKPEWCAESNFMKEDCTSTINPSDHQEFILGALPIIIDSEEKNTLLLLMGILLQITNFIKMKICVYNKDERYSFISCLVINILQFLFFFALQFDIIQVRVMDFLSVLMILLGVPTLKVLTDYFVRVIINSKEILAFSVLFIFIYASTTFVFYNNIEEFYDNNDVGSFCVFNFARFSSAFYTAAINSLTHDNYLDVIDFLQPTFKFGILIWIFYSAIAKIFLQNLLIALMYQNYVYTFNEDVDYLYKNYPHLALEMKQQIIAKNLSSNVLTTLVKRAFLKGHLDQNQLKINDFIEETKNEDNTDCKIQTASSLQFYFFKMMQSKRYQIIFGLIDVAKLLLIVFVNEINNPTYIVYLHFFNFIQLNFYVLESIIKLSSTNFQTSWSNFLEYFTLISCMVAGACFFIIGCFTEFQDEEFFLQENPFYNKLYDLILVINSWSSIRLLFFSELIATIFDVIIKSMVYIRDILQILFTLILLYASLGMILFGGLVTTQTMEKLDETYENDAGLLTIQTNFNDYFNSIFTLILVPFSGFFQIATVNNNFEQGEVNVAYHLYFLSYCLLIMMCLLNIIYGFLIDNCQSYLVEILGVQLQEDEKLAKIQAQKEMEQKLRQKLKKNAQKNFGAKSKLPSLQKSNNNQDLIQSLDDNADLTQPLDDNQNQNQQIYFYNSINKLFKNRCCCYKIF